MFDTQRLGALLRSWMREDALIARLRTLPAAPVRPASPVGPELTSPDPQAAGVSRADLPAEPPAKEPGRASMVGLAREHPEILPAGDEGEASTHSAALRLSDTGRMLLAILRDDPDRASPGRPAMPLSRLAAPELAPGAPVTVKAAAAAPLASLPPQSPDETGRLALALRDTVEFSGLFYESHLAQWAAGQRPRTLLAREPQASWPASPDVAPGDAGYDALPASVSLPLLRDQLETLDTGRYTWRGELWPGHAGALVIGQEDAPARREAGAGAPSRRWRAQVTLTFPALGAIDATISVAGAAVDFALSCNDPRIASQLRADAHTLRAAVADRGLDLASLAVVDEPAA
ncbi:MAG: flagellar hook-length control protein FliK [Casimicrobiaceae bacterium]